MFRAIQTAIKSLLLWPITVLCIMPSLVFAQEDFSDPLSDLGGMRSPLDPILAEPASLDKAGKSPWTKKLIASYSNTPATSTYTSQLLLISPLQRWKVVLGASQRNPENDTDNTQGYATSVDYTFTPRGKLKSSFGIELTHSPGKEDSIKGSFAFEYGLGKSAALSLNAGYGGKDPKIGVSDSDLVSTIGLAKVIDRLSSKPKVGVSYEPENDLNGRDTWRATVTVGAIRLQADNHDGVSARWTIDL